MRRFIVRILPLLTVIAMHGNACATTYNCFEVDKKASLGINGGTVSVDGDKSQKACKFSVDNATVDSLGSKGSSLNVLLQRPEELLTLKDGGLVLFREAMLSPFSDTANDTLAQEFNAVFSPNAAQMAECLVKFVTGSEQHLGFNALICQSVESGQSFEFQGLHGTASESILIIGISLEKNNHVVLFVLPRELALAVRSGSFHFR
jgi:hypothetical protein